MYYKTLHLRKIAGIELSFKIEAAWVCVHISLLNNFIFFLSKETVNGLLRNLIIQFTSKLSSKFFENEKA